MASLDAETWPPSSSWEAEIRSLLKSFTDAGAIVAWYALEAVFAAPEVLFTEEGSYPDGIYAVCLPKGNLFHLSADLEGEYHGLPINILETVQSAVLEGLGP